MVMLHLKLNGITKCNNIVAIVCLQPPSPPQRTWVSKGRNSTFSEPGLGAYQIQGNHNAAT